MLVFRATGCESGRRQRPLHTSRLHVYQLRCDSVHGRLNGTIAMSEVDGNGFLMSRLVRVHVLCFRTLTFTTPTYAAAAQRTRYKVNKREVAAWGGLRRSAHHEERAIQVQPIQGRCSVGVTISRRRQDTWQPPGFEGWSRGADKLQNTVGEHDRTGHAERHALLSIASFWLRDGFDVLVEGHVELHITHFPCISCVGVMAQSSRMFPGVELRLYFQDQRIVSCSEQYSWEVFTDLTISCTLSISGVTMFIRLACCVLTGQARSHNTVVTP